MSQDHKADEQEQEQENDSSEEEEVEPKLKYMRISNDLKKILGLDAVSSIAVHSKFMCIGTHWGAMHLLDHQGNTVENSINRRQNTPTHMVSVNQISIDKKGEYVASCSDDGVVLIHGLYTDEHNQRFDMEKAVKTIAIDPNVLNSESERRFVIGDNRLILYERSFLKGMKQTILSEAEGIVSALEWSDQFIAWASAIGVRVYDLNERTSLGLIKWDEPKDMLLTDFRCNLKWANKTTLLIGWVDIIRVCVIRRRNSTEVSTRDLPGYIVDPISSFQTDFYICGLGPLESDQLVVLGYLKEREAETNKALRPILSVLQYKTNDYIELCSNSLSLRGYGDYKCNDYHLESLVEEYQYFVVSPKDVVVASLYENDDRVKWLIEHGKFDQAMRVIAEHGGKYSLITVARLYLDHLLEDKLYDDAAKLCADVFKNDKVLWEEEVFKFVKVQQLRAVSGYIPTSNEHKLKPHVYEMVLYEYLQYEPPGFLRLIKEWSPSLYNTSAVINAVFDQLQKLSDNTILADFAATLMEALAILYTHERRYDKALAMYLKMQHKDVFVLIKKHNLYNVINTTIVPLMKLDSDQTINVLLEKNKISPEIVVAQLNQHKEGERYLYLYLDSLDKVDNTGKYHDELVRLYAKYGPQKLLPFLRRSKNYNLDKAKQICSEKLFYPEMVYLHERSGATMDALEIIITKLNDIQMAIDFCKKIDDKDLWTNLINKSIKQPEIMTKLLNGIAGFINPEILVNKIQLGQSIPGLQKSLIKMLCDLRLQVSNQDNCNTILYKDYFNLFHKLVQSQQKGVLLGANNTCELCRRDIIVKDSTNMNIVGFNCHHFFHENCLPDKYNISFCIVCKSRSKNLY